MAEVTREREWDYWPQPDGEPFTDKDGHEVLGWHDRNKDQDPVALLAEFEAFYCRSYGRVSASLILRPILGRPATEVECSINGWDEGTFVRCTTRAKTAEPMWQIEYDTEADKPEQVGESNGD